MGTEPNQARKGLFAFTSINCTSPNEGQNVNQRENVNLKEIALAEVLIDANYWLALPVLLSLISYAT